MKLSAAEARLLSAAELDLVRSKGPFEVKSLVKLIQRLRNLRDKARDQLQRQAIALARETGNKRGSSGRGNARSVDKAEVLGRALTHFEEQLARIDQESSAAMKSLRAEAKAEREARAAAKRASGSAGKTKAAPKKAAAASPDRPKASRKSAKPDDTAAEPAQASQPGAEPVEGSGPPVREISSKARQRLPKSIPGPDSGQLKSLPSRRSPARHKRGNL